MKSILLLTILVAAAFGAGPSTPAGDPNVLFIAVDDLNDWTGFLGGRAGVHTPNLDRLAARGVVFSNAHCAAPSCNPSRVSVMTGVRPSTSGIYHNGQDWRDAPRLARAVTIPEHFRAHGYKAIGGGKIFHALSWITDRYGKQQNAPRIWDAYFPSKTRPMPDALWPLAVNVRRGKDGYVSWAPLAQGKSVAGRPPHFFDWGPLQRELPAERMVVLWSDHGMHIGEKEHWEKFTLWEESTRVPLIVVAPGVTKPGGRCDQPVSLLDIYPTLNALCGLPRRDDIEGTSLVDQLRDPCRKRARPAVTTWGRNNHAVRTGRWRYIRYHNGDEELYDHRNDPDEFTNLAAQDRQRWRALMDELAGLLPEINAPPWRATP